MIVIRVSSSRRQYHHQQTTQRKDHENSEAGQTIPSKVQTPAYAIIGNGSIKCVACGLSDHRYLEVDHINGRGDSDIKLTLN